MWREFAEYRRNGRNDGAISRVPRLITHMQTDDAIDHAGDLALWLIERNEWELARRALNRLEMAWWLRFADVRGRGLPVTGVVGSQVGPEQLVQQAETLAARGQHDRSRELFGLAFQILQMLLIAHTDPRFQRLAELNRLPPGTDSALIRLLAYWRECELFTQVRHILGYYARQQRRALAAGQADEAQRLGELDRQLRARLRERYLMTGRGEGSQAITMEATFDVRRGQGAGYVVHGAAPSQREEFVTPLAGSPRPEQLGRHPAYTVSMVELLETIGGQEDFLTEISREPRIRAALRGRQADMNNEETRLLVWRTMYDVYQGRAAPGCSTALCSLLRLVERYLRHFTVHLDYDVRDFGVSYLRSEFPEDLLGRAARDCGIYALKVAYEIYRTARRAAPRLPVGFQLYFTLDHATLAITDQSTGDQYMVSNDQIVGPRRGEPAGAASLAYASLMGYRHSVSVGARTQMLTSSMSEATFRREIWQQYRSGARLTLQPDTAQPGDTRTGEQRREAAYRRYYNVLRLYDQRATSVESLLTPLVSELARHAPSEHPGLLREALEQLTVLGMGMRDILTVLTRDPRVLGLREGATRPVDRIVLLATPEGTENPPIVRVAMALLYAECLDVTLTGDQQALVNWVRQAPWPSFGRALTEYRPDGRRPVF
jgi:hypothetical protein